MISSFCKADNIVGKGKSAGNQYFLHFQLCFQKAISWAFLSVGILW